MREKLNKIISLCFLLAALNIVLLLTVFVVQHNYEKAIAIQEETIQELANANDDVYRLYKEALVEIDLLKSQDQYTQVRFTNYYEGDGSSGSVTGSGLSTADFEINSLGWYTYQGKVVIATATWECIRSETGACKNYNSVPKGFEVYNYYDEVEIVIDGVSYQSIVLDSCGGSYWNEDLQRVDIFIANSDYAFGSATGFIK